MGQGSMGKKCRKKPPSESGVGGYDELIRFFKPPPNVA